MDLYEISPIWVRIVVDICWTNWLRWEMRIEEQSKSGGWEVSTWGVEKGSGMGLAGRQSWAAERKVREGEKE